MLAPEKSRGPPGAITWAPMDNHVGPLGQSRGPPGAITWAPRGNHVGPLGQSHSILEVIGLLWKPYKIALLGISYQHHIQWWYLSWWKPALVRVRACTTETGKTLDTLLNHSGLDYASGLDLLFCWLSRLQIVMEEMLILQIKLRKYIMCITVKSWVCEKFKMYPSSIWKYYLTW